MIEGNIKLTEDWLRAVGFKWHQFDRQPSKHWLLWIGAMVDAATDDLGIEVASGAMNGEWFCWLRSDFAGRYSRSIHVRHIRLRSDVVNLFEGITCQSWKPENHMYGQAVSQITANRWREEADRIDRRIAAERDKAIARHSGEPDDEAFDRALKDNNP